MRILDRIFAGGGGDSIFVATVTAVVGLACDVLDWRIARVAGAVYSNESAGSRRRGKEHRAASTGQVLRAIGGQWKRFVYLVILMTFMMFLSHWNAGFVSLTF